MHKNSLKTWHGEIKPTLRKRQLQVLKVVQHIGGKGTARDVMSTTGQTSNVIHPRLGELRDLGYLTEIGDKKIDGRNHTIYALTELGMSVNTDTVKDITPAKKYYSIEDYKQIVREVYDHLVAEQGLDQEKARDLYEDLRLFLAKKQ